MRLVAELLGIALVLIGGYYGGRDILDRWMNGPVKAKPKRK